MSDTTKRSTYGIGQLTDALMVATGLSRSQAASAIKALPTIIADQVKNGQAVTWTGFGTFKRTERQARTGTNIRTRQPIHIPAQSSVRFTPGSDLKAAVGGRQARSGASYAAEREKAGLGQARQVGETGRQKGRAVH